VYGQPDTWDRFAVIVYDDDNSLRQFVFSARQYDKKPSSYICQWEGLLIIQPHCTECTTLFKKISCLLKSRFHLCRELEISLYI